MAWLRGKKILALWADWESRNCWVYVNDPADWYQLRSDNFDAIQYMITALTHAKANDRPVDVNEDPQRTISEIYVW
jgi:hypothetical protein